MAIVYDFDLTLTSVHTGGMPSVNIDYFGDRLPKIRSLFQRSIYPIYVNTRGLRDPVREYLHSRDLLQYVTDVYGANTVIELAAGDWPQRKVRVLDQIRKRHSLTKDQIYFYDDTPENILAARENGYINSHLFKLSPRKI